MCVVCVHVCVCVCVCACACACVLCMCTFVTLLPEMSRIDTRSHYRRQQFLICRSKILIFSFHQNQMLQALFSGILNCNCCNTVVCKTNFLSPISQNGTRYVSQIDLSITFEPVGWFCIILVSFERNMNAFYKCVKMKILWEASMWLVLEGRVTFVCFRSREWEFERIWRGCWSLHLTQKIIAMEST